MWVGTSLIAPHTPEMPRDIAVTAFVTGAAGGLGTALITALRAQGCQVSGLAESTEGAQRVRRAGAVPVLGSLLEPGPWQDQAVADWVFHLPPGPLDEARLTRRRARSIGRVRLRMDSQLLDALAGSATRRIVYVADTSCYGPVGARPVTEDEPPRPSALGRIFAPALEQLNCYIAAGLPIATALPGLMYGHSSWFRACVVEPVMAGRRVLQFGPTGAWVSAIHVEDCARALVHLAEHGKPGGRYFLVNDDPVRTHELASAFARVARRRFRAWRLPMWIASLAIGGALADFITADAVFSNIRLRGLGFRFRYPALEEGLLQVARSTS
jgi:nucleoside-diphosphate-sugar epimerase